MNKYIIPICDIQAGVVWNQVILARNVLDCQEKLILFLVEKYDLEDCLTYREFIAIADENDILIGEIKDVEEL